MHGSSHKRPVTSIAKTEARWSAGQGLSARRHHSQTLTQGVQNLRVSRSSRRKSARRHLAHLGVPEARFHFLIQVSSSKVDPGIQSREAGSGCSSAT